MNYKAENVDTEKALAHIEYLRKRQDEKERMEMTATQKFYEGVRKGLDMAEEIFECSNFEKQAATGSYYAGVCDAIYKIAKELGIESTDILNSEKEDGEKCADFAAKIKDYFKEYYTE